MNKNPILIKEVINEFSKNFGFYDAIIMNQIIEKWEEIVGNPIANNAKIVKLQKKVLIIKTTSSTWRVELLSRKEKIIELINSAIGERTVLKLIIR